MVIFRIDEILLNCSPQDHRRDHVLAAVHVYVVSFSYFILFFYTRHRLDQYSCSFMIMVPPPPASSTPTLSTHPFPVISYPLLQSDLYHRLMLAVYGLGTFVMTMNIVLIITNSETTSSSSSSSSTTSSHTTMYSDLDWSSFVGACHFQSDYTIGFASGFLITRVLSLITVCMWMTYAADVRLKKQYFSFGLCQVIQLLVSLGLISFLFRADSYNNNNNTHHDSSNNNNHPTSPSSLSIPDLNRLNIRVLTALAVWESIWEVLCYYYRESMLWWREREDGEKDRERDREGEGEERGKDEKEGEKGDREREKEKRRNPVFLLSILVSPLSLAHCLYLSLS